MHGEFDSHEPDIDSVGFTDEERQKFTDGTIQEKIEREIRELAQTIPSLRELVARAYNAELNPYQRSEAFEMIIDKVKQIHALQRKVQERMNSAMDPFSHN